MRWTSSARVAFFAAGLPLVAACTSSETSIVEPTTDKCTVLASTSATTFTAAGGAGVLIVTAGRDCPWAIVSGATWIAPPHHAGQGNAQVPFTVAVNTATAARSGHLDVSGSRVDLTQGAATPPPAPVPTPAPAPPPSPPPSPTPSPVAVSLEGDVTRVSGSCPDVTFVVNGQSVAADRATEFKKGRCSDLRPGASVKVAGTRQGAGPIRATRVEFQKQGNDEDRP